MVPSFDIWSLRIRLLSSGFFSYPNSWITHSPAPNFVSNHRTKALFFTFYSILLYLGTNSPRPTTFFFRFGFLQIKRAARRNKDELLDIYNRIYKIMATCNDSWNYHFILLAKLEGLALFLMGFNVIGLCIYSHIETWVSSEFRRRKCRESTEGISRSLVRRWSVEAVYSKHSSRLATRIQSLRFRRARPHAHLERYCWWRQHFLLLYSVSHSFEFLEF